MFRSPEEKSRFTEKFGFLKQLINRAVQTMSHGLLAINRQPEDVVLVEEFSPETQPFEFETETQAPSDGTLDYELLTLLEQEGLDLDTLSLEEGTAIMNMLRSSTKFGNFVDEEFTPPVDRTPETEPAYPGRRRTN